MCVVRLIINFSFSTPLFSKQARAKEAPRSSKGGEPQEIAKSSTAAEKEKEGG